MWLHQQFKDTRYIPISYYYYRMVPIVLYGWSLETMQFIVLMVVGRGVLLSYLVQMMTIGR